MTNYCDFRNLKVTVGPMATTSERVRSVVTTSGLSQHDFARRIGLDDSKLSKTLSGARRFSSLDLARIADEFDVTVDWLLNGRDTGSAAVAARSAGGSGTTAMSHATRLDTLRSDMTYLGFAQPWRGLAIEPNGRSYVRDGERLAEAALERIDDMGQTSSAADLASLVEETFGADVAVVELDEKFDGLAVSSSETKLILLATSAVPGRQRFTLAHELGHLLTGDDQRVHIDKDVYGSEHKADHSEKRANAFAAAFLMPRNLLRTKIGTGSVTEESMSALALDLRVSPSALAYRLLSCDLIDSAQFDRFKGLTGPKAAQLTRRDGEYAALISASSSPRPPGLLLRDTYAAYEAGKATMRPYAGLVGVPTDQLRRDLEVGDVAHSLL